MLCKKLEQYHTVNKKVVPIRDTLVGTTLSRNPCAIDLKISGTLAVVQAHVPMKFQIDPSNFGRTYFFAKSLRDRADISGDAYCGPSACSHEISDRSELLWSELLFCEILARSS